VHDDIMHTTSITADMISTTLFLIHKLVMTHLHWWCD